MSSFREVAAFPFITAFIVFFFPNFGNSPLYSSSFCLEHFSMLVIFLNSASEFILFMLSQIHVGSTGDPSVFSLFSMLLQQMSHCPIFFSKVPEKFNQPLQRQNEFNSI